MAFNNGFPVTYPQMYPTIQPPVQPPQMPVQQSNSMNNGIVWVQGEAGAKAYPVAAGNTVMMLDSESQVFYLKSTAANGMPQPLRIFDFTERTQSAANPVIQNNFDPNKYVTREELDERLAALAPKRTTKKEVTDNGKSTT